MSEQWYCPNCGPIDKEHVVIGGITWCRICQDVRVVRKVPPFVTALQARIAELKAAQRDAFEVASEAPELNMGNYDHDQVRALNNAMIEIYCILQPPPQEQP